MYKTNCNRVIKPVHLLTKKIGKNGDPDQLKRMSYMVNSKL